MDTVKKKKKDHRNLGRHNYKYNWNYEFHKKIEGKGTLESI